MEEFDKYCRDTANASAKQKKQKKEKKNGRMLPGRRKKNIFRGSILEKPLLEPVICTYCGTAMQKKESWELLLEEVNMRPGWKTYYYVCESCSSRCRAQRNSKGIKKLVSTPANLELRQLRIDVHAAFDLIMQEKHWRKDSLYRFLSSRVFGDGAVRHIGEYQAEDCRKAMEVLKKLLEAEDT